jgi:hypothetical protein
VKRYVAVEGPRGVRIGTVIQVSGDQYVLSDVVSSGEFIAFTATDPKWNIVLDITPHPGMVLTNGAFERVSVLTKTLDNGVVELARFHMTRTEPDFYDDESSKLVPTYSYHTVKTTDFIRNIVSNDSGLLYP